jgi:hypothetical protein
MIGKTSATRTEGDGTQNLDKKTWSQRKHLHMFPLAENQKHGGGRRSPGAGVGAAVSIEESTSYLSSSGCWCQSRKSPWDTV